MHQGGGAAAAIDIIEVLMAESGSKHAPVTAAVAGNAEVGPCLASLLTHGDKKLREKAARLLYVCASASEHGADFWQALERAGHTAAIVAGHCPGTFPGKAGRTGARGERRIWKSDRLVPQLEVVSAGGLNYLVQLA